MKTIVFPALLAAVVIFSACEQRTDSATPQAVASDPAADMQDRADRTSEIAGDKGMMADVMQRSFQKGTFDDALAMAIQDSALAAEVVEVIRANPKYASFFDDKTSPSAKSQTAATASKQSSGSTKSRTSSSTSRGTTQTSSRDPLDKAEQTVQKANEKLEQAERVRQQVEEARRKAEGILRPR